jgi:hypothetical protein
MKPRNPTNKKQIAYRKDHVYHAESQQAFRKTWPLIKAWSKREERHKVREKLINLTDADEDAQGDFALKPVRRKKVQKFAPVVPLGESVQQRLYQRGRMLGANLLKAQYSTEEHRDRFIALLESVTRMEGEAASGFARMMELALLPGPIYDQWGYLRRPSPNLVAWLHTFVADAPEWEPRLRAWVEGMLSEGE